MKTAIKRGAEAAQVRHVTWSDERKTVRFFFDRSEMRGRRFSLRVLANGKRLRLVEDGAGNAVTTGGVVQFSLGREPLTAPGFSESVSAEPTVSGNGLVYDVSVPEPAAKANGGGAGQLKPTVTRALRQRQLEAAVEPTAPVAVPPLLDRTDTTIAGLRALLERVRRVERTTPYRLERGASGELEFVAAAIR